MPYSIPTLVALLLGVGCAYAPPKGLSPVKDFDLQKYLGTWYEIARLDHSFERGLTDVTADYSFRPDGAVRVLNRGFDARKDAFRQAEGKARLVGDARVGQLKVSFFGPFYAPYNIVSLDSDYQLALVCSSGTDYLWILSRTPTVEKEKLDPLLALARSAGFATDQLIYVTQARAKPPAGASATP